MIVFGLALLDFGWADLDVSTRRALAKAITTSAQYLNSQVSKPALDTLPTNLNPSAARDQLALRSCVDLLRCC